LSKVKVDTNILGYYGDKKLPVLFLCISYFRMVIWELDQMW